MTDKITPEQQRLKAALEELMAAAEAITGSPVNKYLVVTGHENGRVEAGYGGCPCAACRLMMMAAAGREMGGRMHGVRLPDDMETIARAVDAAGRVH